MPSFPQQPLSVDALLAEPADLEHPSLQFKDFLSQIFNSLCKDNVELKANEMKKYLMDARFYTWFALYLVKNRAAKEVNLYVIYIDFIDRLNVPKLVDTILNTTYGRLRILLKADSRDYSA